MIKTGGILLEVLSNLLASIGQQMGYTLERTAYTVYVKFTGDFAAGILNKDGETVAVSYPSGVVSTATQVAKPFIDSIPEQDYHEGDIVLSNDPYFTGGLMTHLPDISMIKPVFHKGEIICFGWCFIHQSDIGGSIPGSILLTNYEIFQEGLRIPQLKLYKAGELNEDLLKIYQANVRIPEDNWGDLQAMVSALNVGEARIHEAIDKYGVETIKQAMQDVLEWGQIRAEKIIDEIPEGASAEFVDYLDDDAVSDVPVRIKAKVTKKDKKLHVDWTGTDPQTRSAVNLITQGNSGGSCKVLLQSFFTTADPGIPLNGGMGRVVDMLMPEGSLLNPTFPAAGGARTGTWYRLMDALLGCLIQLLPGKLPATNGGTSTIVNVSEPDLKSGIPGKRNVLTVQPMNGSCGGRPYKDGMDARSAISSLPASNPLEMLESDCSLQFTEWGDRIDSGGPGKFRGGNGLVFEFKASAPNTIITARGSGRLNFQPWGVKGGKPGGKQKVTLNPRTSKEKVFKENIDWLRLDPGDVIRFEIPGGGGYGNPLERDVEKVLYDVKQGFVSSQAAEKDYGVIIKDGEVDYEGTTKLREEMMKSYEYKEFDFGPYREQYEKVWTPEIYDEMEKILYSLPSDYRNYIKWKLFPRINALAKQKTVDKSNFIREWEKLKQSEAGLKKY